MSDVVLNRQPSILVMDALALRRSALQNFLSHSPALHEWRIDALNPEDADVSAAIDESCRLVLFNLGAISIASASACMHLKRLKACLPEAALIVLSDHDTRDEMRQAFSAGVSGFIPAGTSPEVALRAVLFILGGGSYFPPNLMLGDDAAPPREGEAPSPGSLSSLSANLTPRQQAVLSHLQDGKPNKIIARILGMQESTVKVHVRQIIRKLGATNRTQAALIAAVHTKRMAQAQIDLPGNEMAVAVTPAAGGLSSAPFTHVQFWSQTSK